MMTEKYTITKYETIHELITINHHHYLNKSPHNIIRKQYSTTVATCSPPPTPYCSSI